MKTSVLVPISFALLTVASPLGDRTVFRRNSGTPQTRRYLLQSRLDSPAACAALSLSNSSTTALPNLSNATTPLTNATTNDNTTVSDNSTTIDPPTTDNSTTVDNSTSVDDSGPSTLSRRKHSVWKRIAQDDLPDVALGWQKLCLNSGGDIFTLEPCVNYAGINGINALLASADPCDQQDNADAMITFAKSAGVKNRDALIATAISYRKHPRNALNILGVIPSTPYCQKAPQNPELIGVVNEQLDGVDPGLFGSPSVPIMPFGAPGTCPFGQTPDVSTCTCINGTDTSSVNATETATSATDTATDDTASTDDSTPTATDSGAVSATAAADTTTVDDSATSSTVAPAATTDIATPTVTSQVADATAKSSGPNIQPSDISGDVNDING